LIVNKTISFDLQ